MAETPTPSRLGLGSGTAGGAQVLLGSAWMLASTLVVSAGSFVFWLIAARGADAEIVGRSAALFSTVFFLTFITSLGIPVAVGRFAATASPPDTLRFRLALETVAVLTTVGVTVFVVIDPAAVLSPVQQWGQFVAWLTMSLLSVGIAVSVLVDVRLMGHRAWRQVFNRSAAIALIRLPPLALAVRDETGFWVFVVATGGYAVTALPYLPGLLRGAAPRPRTWSEHATVAHYAAVNSLSQLAIGAPFFATPLIVALAVDAEENATFYLSWGIMSVVYLGIGLLGRTLLVEGSRDERLIAREARSTLAVGLAVAITATLLAVPIAPVLERMYGSGHDAMSRLLPVLMLGTVPWVVSQTALAMARAHAHTVPTLAVATWAAVSVVVGVALGAAVGGSDGAATGWLSGSMVALAVSLPTLIAYLRPRA